MWYTVWDAKTGISIHALREEGDGKRTLQEVAQYMNCQEAYYKNFDDHGRLLRLRRLCYAIFGGRVPCSKSSKPVMAPSLP